MDGILNISPGWITLNTNRIFFPPSVQEMLVTYLVRKWVTFLSWWNCQKMIGQHKKPGKCDFIKVASGQLYTINKHNSKMPSIVTIENWLK